MQLQLDADQTVDDELLIESAALALIESDTSLTLRLLRRVDPAHHNVRYQQLMGEVLYNRGRFDEAADVWYSMDLDDMDDVVDEGERMVRRTILEHLSVNPRQDLVASLILVSTVQDADTIFVLNHGRVVESGSHSQLLKIPGGVYARLWGTQGGRPRSRM